MARLSFRFLRRRRARTADLAAATAAEDTERAMAVQRILDLAHANLALSEQQPTSNRPARNALQPRPAPHDPRARATWIRRPEVIPGGDRPEPDPVPSTRGTPRNGQAGIAETAERPGRATRHASKCWPISTRSNSPCTCGYALRKRPGTSGGCRWPRRLPGLFPGPGRRDSRTPIDPATRAPEASRLGTGEDPQPSARLRVFVTCGRTGRGGGTSGDVGTCWAHGTGRGRPVATGCCLASSPRRRRRKRKSTHCTDLYNRK